MQGLHPMVYRLKDSHYNHLARGSFKKMTYRTKMWIYVYSIYVKLIIVLLQGSRILVKESTKNGFVVVKKNNNGSTDIIVYSHTYSSVAIRSSPKKLPTPHSSVDEDPEGYRQVKAGNVETSKRRSPKKAPMDETDEGKERFKFFNFSIVSLCAYIFRCCALLFQLSKKSTIRWIINVMI